MESLTENRLNVTTSSAIFQVHERCFTPSLSEFEHIKMQNGTMAHLKIACGPPMHHATPVGNQWTRKTTALYIKCCQIKLDRR